MSMKSIMEDMVDSGLRGKYLKFKWLVLKRFLKCNVKENGLPLACTKNKAAL